MAPQKGGSHRFLRNGTLHEKNASLTGLRPPQKWSDDMAQLKLPWSKISAS